MLLCRKADLGLGHGTGQRPAIDVNHLSDPVVAEVRAFEMLQVGRGQGGIDQPEVLHRFHPEDVAGDPAQQLDCIAFFPEFDRVRDLHDIALDIERGRLQRLHPRRHGEKGSPGAG